MLKTQRLLPAWNGHVVSACHRMGITMDSLAQEIGINRTYLSGIINGKRKSTEYTRSLIEDGLRSRAKSMGFDYDNDVLATENDLQAGLTKRKE